MTKKLSLVAAVLFCLACDFEHLTVSNAQSIVPHVVHGAVPDTRITRYSSSLDAILAPDATIEKIATGFLWTEGPMWHKGALWFSDLSGNKMYSLTPSGTLKVQLNRAGGLQSFPNGAYGGSNAMVAAKNGTVLMMQHGLRRIVQLDE